MKLMKHLPAFALAISVIAPVAAHASTLTYDAVASFSTASNPNGVWSYAGGTPLAPVLFTYSGAPFPGIGDAYWAAVVGGLPVVGGAGAVGGTVNVPSDELWLHPGPNAGEDSMVIFTATTAGTYSIDALFVHRDTGGTSNGNADGQIVGVYVNGILVSDTLLGTTYGDHYHFNQTITLGVGDTVTFDVGKNGTYYNDSTGLKAVISETPEPSSLALLGTGIMGVAGFARRRFKK